MKTFNINSYIYIQINEDGWEHLRKTVRPGYIKHSILPYEVEINGEKWYRLQCHQVFDILPIRFGSMQFFNTNILIDDNSLKNYDQ